MRLFRNVTVLSHFKSVYSALRFIQSDFYAGLLQPFGIGDAVVVKGVKFRRFDIGIGKTI